MLNKESSRSLWFVSSWIVRLTATFRLRSRVGSKKHLVPVDRQALHGASGPEHYIEQITKISHCVPNFRTRRRGRNGKEKQGSTDAPTHLPLCLFACQASCGILLWPTDSSRRLRSEHARRPRSQRGKLFCVLVGAHLHFQKISLPEYDIRKECLGISDRNIPRLKLPRQWEFDEATIGRN